MSQLVDFHSLNESLQQQGMNYWQQLVDKRGDVLQSLSQAHCEQIKYCFAMSDFIAQSCIYQPKVFDSVFLNSPLDASHIDQYIERIDALSQCIDEKAFMQQIRILRKTLMTHIAALDMYRMQSIAQSYRLVSSFSDALVLSAYHYAYQQIAKVFGCPKNADGSDMPLVILAMGKFGGMELNFSSDIDLICGYADGGETSGGRKVIDNQMFFTKVAQKLIQYLHQSTVDGFVFRVDMRLRPFGDSGPLVMSFAAMETYYQEQGRDWERYAMLKSRVIGLEQHPDGHELIAMLRPFVYRRYIDFSVIDSLRKMKQLISQESRRKTGATNIKLGAGGIREVEFIAQALQLIRGGREKQLQVRNLIDALARLCQSGDINSEQQNILSRNYLYLRQCEHYLQQFDDKQTQVLPDSELDQLRLCYLFGHKDWTSFIGFIDNVMASVHTQFKWIIAEEQAAGDSSNSEYELFWQGLDNFEQAQESLPEALSKLGQTISDEFIKQLIAFKSECQKRAIGQRGRTVLDSLVPMIIVQVTAQAVDSSADGQTLKRVLNVVSKVASRTAYLELLNENMGALNQLIKLCAQSGWVAHQLALQPILLDELIDPQMLYRPTELNAYCRELDEYIMRVPEDDMEQQLEALRHFKHAHQLRIAAADISGVLDVVAVSRHLTAMAEAIFTSVVNIAWKQISERFGEPQGRSITDKGFAVIAYGKMGGMELGYDSDLDVVFVHDCQQGKVTTGAKQIDSRQFYLKLCQRIVHIFTSRTVSGILYEIDNRLRPQGNSGLLACHMETYHSYLKEEAWTWEHQALVRTRLVLGEPRLLEQFTDIRRDIIKTQRDKQDLQNQVVKMRTKMRDNLEKKQIDKFDLKQGLGGIADIEFITQYLVLAYANEYDDLTDCFNNEQLFKRFANHELISQEQAKVLSQVYRVWREIYHRQSIQDQDKLIVQRTGDTTSGYAEQVIKIWQQVFGSSDGSMPQ